MGFKFECVPPKIIDEQSFFDSADITGSLERLATAKAQSVSESHPDALVLGADTVVVFEGEVFGKPRTRSDAKRMLCRLSGQTHRVYSAVALVCGACTFAGRSTGITDVRFRSISEEELRRYLDGNTYRDKAGAYGIQDSALVFIECINGCYYNVAGLPVAVTIQLFQYYDSTFQGRVPADE